MFSNHLRKLFVAVKPFRRGRLYHKSHKPTTYDDMPVPCGSWDAANEMKQRKNNMILGGGIGIVLFSIGMGVASGKIFLNFYPPQI